MVMYEEEEIKVGDVTTRVSHHIADVGPRWKKLSFYKHH